MAGAGVGGAWVFSLPFVPAGNFYGSSSWFLAPFVLLKERFLYAADYYSSASANAFNFWFALGQNWKPDSQLFWGVSYQQWGLILFTVSCVPALLFLLLKHRPPRRGEYFAVAALIMLAAFSFMTRAHERHIAPFFPLFLLVAWLGQVRSRLAVYTTVAIVAVADTYYAYASTYGHPIFYAAAARWLAAIPPVASVVFLVLIIWPALKRVAKIT